MLSYMERGAYPPEYDEPEATKQEVLDVLAGRKVRDGLGRDFDDLMSDTSMTLVYELLTDDGDAERDLMTFLGQRWGDVPASVKAVFESLAESTAKE